MNSSPPPLSPSSSSDRFNTSQIVCLEAEKTYLYAEVIQIIPDRQMCWVRPLLLAIFNEFELDKIYDLRSASDLVWPDRFFRAAIDTEVIPLIVELEASSTVIRETNLIRPQLHRFLQRIWQTE
ncbi:hypothetical protein [Oscillatoria sp. FACHB-1406]|uniref:hypothetical protein n=1 Tax=Oscillatoria sp. FACHB-1406 TaxID=2692846 RepID=UPI001682C186|nr:hypothetical protein [Oscillatoria sp. FACHB-1406]MBD2576849.1 hypothetical protein [Oscillatoria sp. FACHB-1406]